MLSFAVAYAPKEVKEEEVECGLGSLAGGAGGGVGSLAGGSGGKDWAHLPEEAEEAE